MRRKAMIVAFLSTMVSGLVYAAGVDSALVTRPEGTSPFQADSAVLLAKGEQLWNDKSLSKKGKTACSSCHKTSTKMFKKTFLEEYPHSVKMAKKKAKMSSISAEGMVQFCMIVPMKAKPLAWDSEELAALTAYSEGVIQQNYIKAKSGK